ncbi:MAG TPA: LuxR C-terminal-related transcriptional regulator, partial [Ilumatobacter sp.]
SAAPRHRTLAASLEWSCARLEQSEALAFRRLAVFTGALPIEAAVRVIGEEGSIGEAEAVDLVGRLVDKSLVVAEPAVDGSMRYRMLETVRAYALDEADVGELDLARETHVAFWLEWLEPIAVMPSDAQLAQVAAYEGNLRAALDWAARDPSRGLRLLARLARVWAALGRANSLLHAADILLASDNDTRHPDVWLPAAVESAMVYLAGRGVSACVELTERIDEVACRIGDDYHRLLGKVVVYDSPAELIAVRDAAAARGDRYRASQATIGLAELMAEADPAAAAPFLADAASAASTDGNAALRGFERVVVITAARSRGDLRRCIELARAELAGTEMAAKDQQLVIELSAAGLLARDGDALKAAAAEADAVEWVAPGVAGWANRARTRLALFEGAPSRVDELITSAWETRWPATTATMWLLGREAIDAGQREPIADWARRVAQPRPHYRAVLAAIEGAAADDEDRWHEALSLAVAHHLPLIAVDALENLAALAVRAESWQEGGRLLGAASRLRDETGYRWRFAAEQRRVDDALAAVRLALGDAADVCATEGRDRTWHEAAEYASRARGERRRPRHGWLSLTPTELRVVELVAEGCTNPQIAERLMMGRATVKTHLDHVYAKVGARGRSQLAAEFARRQPPR